MEASARARVIMRVKFKVMVTVMARAIAGVRARCDGESGIKLSPKVRVRG